MLLSSSESLITLSVNFKFSNWQPAGDPIRVGLVPTLSRPRNPTIANTPARVSEYSIPY